MLPLPEEDRRRHPRYSCHHPIVVVLDRAGQSLLLDGECRTLSRHGFGAVITGDLPPGRIVAIHFQAHGMKEPVRLQARVLYQEEGLHGFEFIAPDEKQRELIATLFREAVDPSSPLGDAS